MGLRVISGLARKQISQGGEQPKKGEESVAIEVAPEGGGTQIQERAVRQTKTRLKSKKPGETWKKARPSGWFDRGAESGRLLGGVSVC